MRPLENILVGTDNTTKSLGALRFASALASRAGLPLTALHAYLYPPDHYYLPDMMFSNFRLADSTVRQDALDALNDQMRRADLEGARHEVTPGAAHVALLERAESSLIVVGHAHRKASARLIAGSVATRVVRGATGPVVVVPPGDERALPRKVLIADDFSEPVKSIPALLSALGLLKDATVEVVYCLEDAMEPYMHAIENVDKEMPQRWEAMQRGFSEMLAKRYAAQEDVGGTWSTQVLRGEFAADTILEHAQREKFDLVAVASRGKGAVARTLLGSTTEALVHQAKMPVLVTH